VTIGLVAGCLSIGPAAEAAAPEPGYADPPSACTLVKAATVAADVPDATSAAVMPGNHPAVPLPAVLHRIPVPYESNCIWTVRTSPGQLSESLSVDVSVYGSAADAQQSFANDVQDYAQNGTGVDVTDVVTGTDELARLGNQATAILETCTSPLPGGQAVELVTWSGNAELEVFYAPPRAANQSARAALLNAAKVLASQVLAALPKG
jgi:hypothetical protein